MTPNRSRIQQKTKCLGADSVTVPLSPARCHTANGILSSSAQQARSHCIPTASPQTFCALHSANGKMVGGKWTLFPSSQFLQLLAATSCWRLTGRIRCRWQESVVHTTLKGRGAAQHLWGGYREKTQGKSLVFHWGTIGWEKRHSQQNRNYCVFDACWCFSIRFI